MGVTQTDKFTSQQNAIASFAKAIGHPARVAILQELFKVDGCICNDLSHTVKLAQPTISQHLQVLKKAELIQGSINGTSVCYCINKDTWSKMKSQLAELFDLDLLKQVDCC